MATLKRAIKKVWFKKMSMREAARVYQIPPSTLQQKLKALRQKQAERARQKAGSSAEEEGAAERAGRRSRRQRSSQAGEDLARSEEEAERDGKRSRRQRSSQADEDSARSEEEAEHPGRRSRRQRSSQADEDSAKSEEEEGEEEEAEEEAAEQEEEAVEEEEAEDNDKEGAESEVEANQEEEEGLGNEPKGEVEEVQEEEGVEAMEVKEEEDAHQLEDVECVSLSPKKEEVVQVKVQTKAARRAPAKSKPREAKDKTRTRKSAAKSSAVSKQSPRRTPKQSPSRTPKPSPVQTPKQSPQRTGKQSPSEMCTVAKGRPRIFSASRSKSRMQESKVKTSCDIVKPALGKGRLKAKLPDKKPKAKESASTEWDSELTQEEEDELIRQADAFKSQGLHLTMEILLDFAQNILNENPYKMRSFVDNRPTKEWYQHFVRRHPILNTPVLTIRKTARQISQEERKRKASEPVKTPPAANKKTKKKQAKGSRKRKDSQAESSYSEVDDSGNAGTTTEEEEIDTNICSMCQAEYNDQPDEWIGCSSCERWFHKFCIHIDVTGYSDKEIEALDFICEFCVSRAGVT